MELNDDSQFGEIIAGMEKELNPPNMQEFELGMTIGAFIDSYINPEVWPDEAIDGLISTAGALFDTWLEKYNDMFFDYNNVEEVNE
jgi:hypothetical protein